MNGYLKAAVPHIIAVVVCLVVACAYYLPAVQGKVLSQSDNVKALGMQKEINEIRGEGKAHPLWTNSMFGGMPVFQIHLPNGNNLTAQFNRLFLLGGTVTSPHSAMFLMMIMFYIMMIAFGVGWRTSLIGALAYGLATNHVVLTEAGHSTKVITMAYVPPMLGGIWLAFRGKYLVGGVMTALFFSLQLLANHVQITFYFFITLLLLGIFEGVKAFRKQELAQFGKAVAVLVFAGVVGLGSNIARIWTTYEYTDETIRGKSEITVTGKYNPTSSSDKESGDGLSKEYIFGWSYGIGETWTVLVPDYMGRSSGTLFTEGSKSLPALRKVMNQSNQQQLNQAAQRGTIGNTYHGDVTFTSGPIYFGAIICFLFILGFFVVKDNFKWWWLGSLVILTMLAWGKHFPALNYFLVENVPMFNKFRAVMMALGLAQVFVTAFGILALKELISNTELGNITKDKAVLYAGGITGGLCLLLYVAAMMGMIDFTGGNDDANILGQYPELWNAMKADRQAMMQSDALRSFLFIALAAGTLWAYATNKIKSSVAIPIVGLLIVVDFWLVDQRFLTHDDFETKQQSTASVQPNAADQQILNDPDLHFRVLDYSEGNPFTSTRASYFHKSIGGYHAAKLMRFQDLCEHYLFGSPAESQHILGMLNTKYIIQNQGQGPIAINNNQAALDNAWFVEEYELVENADAEIAGLATLDPRRKALIEKKFESYLEGIKLDSIIAGDYIDLISYHPDKMEYEVKTQNEQLAVFSEIYYPTEKGWNVYIDGKKVDDGFIKANYVLRAMRLPAGEYKLEMRFEPSSFYTGRTIGLISSLLIIGGVIFMLFRSYQTFEPPVNPVREERPTDPKPKRSGSNKSNNKTETRTRRKPPKKRKKK